jgi:hypothetical protein
MCSLDQTCPNCGYVRQPWESECPRCARRVSTPCEECGRVGVIGECDRCHRDLCEVCAVREGGAILCPGCHRQVAASGEEEADQTKQHARQVGLSGPAAGAFPFGVRHSAGLWDSVSRALVFIRESVRMCFRDKDLIIPSLLSLAVSLVFLGAVLGVLWGTGLLDQIRGDGKGGGVLAAVIGIAVAFCMYMISYFFTAMTVHLVDTFLKGRDAQLGAAFADAKKNLFALISLAIVSTLVAVATSALRRRGRGGAGEAVGAAIDKLWTVATFLLLPVIILEDVSLGRALGRARSLHGRNLIPIAVGEIAVSLVTGVIGFAVVLLAAAALFAAASAFGAVAVLPLAIVGAVVFAAVVAFNHYLRTAYYTCLYLWAAAAEQAGETALAPAPLAAALQ